MAKGTIAADRIVEVVSRFHDCLLDEVVLACPDLTWNQVFLGVDRLSREGKVVLTKKGPGGYAVRLPDK
jgi:hypothetical protein